jgi:hypothetical protein
MLAEVVPIIMVVLVVMGQAQLVVAERVQLVRRLLMIQLLRELEIPERQAQIALTQVGHQTLVMEQLQIRGDLLHTV